MKEFTMLFMALASINLNDQNDQISWKWTKDGKYSVSSAYSCQFLGAMTRLPADDLWKAASEPKCKFFGWLVLQDRVLTADNMEKKNWPCDPMCSFCFCFHETTPHLLNAIIQRQSGILWQISSLSLLLGPCMLLVALCTGRTPSETLVVKRRKRGSWVSFLHSGGTSGKRETAEFFSTKKLQHLV
jgi:hypothetical protein